MTVRVKVSETDYSPQHLIEKLVAGTNVTITKVVTNGVETLVIAASGGGGVADIFFKVSSADTTESYGDSKLAAGTGITKTILNPGGNEQLEIKITANGVSDALLRQGTACTVVGRSANSTGNVADIAAGSNNTVLKRASNALSFASVTGSDMATNTVSNTEIRQGGATSVIGRSANSTGNVADISASADGQVLKRASSALTFAQIAAADIANNAIGNAQIRQSAGLSVIGRSANSTGDVADITGVTVGHVLQVLAGPTLGFGAGGGGGGAPTNARYLTLALDGTLSDERVFVPSGQFVGTDGGANNNYALNLKLGGLRQYYENHCFTATTDNVVSAQGAGTGNSTTSAAGEAGHPGIVLLTTGTTATGRQAVATTNLNQVLLGGTGLIYTFEAFFKITTLSDGTNTYTLRLGWIDSVSAEPTDGVYLRYTHSANSGNWVGVARAANTESVLNSSTAVTSGTWTRATIVCDGTAGNATFYINGTSLGTALTTNIPTAGGQETGFGVYIQKSLGTTARTISLDVIAHETIL